MACVDEGQKLKEIGQYGCDPVVPHSCTIVDQVADSFGAVTDNILKRVLMLK